ncbi:MAG TPA: hypothetical protein VNX28_15525, partial [Gemmataceae bacterium]|nr:hypothetical protein [Gemmataceae bacterium]
MTPQLQTVHVRVSDAATRQPTPVRVRFTDADGTYYAPLGRLTDFATEPNQDVGGSVRLGTCSWAYVPGSFEIKLPPGTIHIEIHKGPEYGSWAHTIQLTPGKLALRFHIERWIDLPAQGWYSGDGRAHFLSPHAALLEAQAEDVHVVNLLAAPTRGNDASGRKEAIADLLAFSGQEAALEAPGHVVVVNTHNTHPVLGSLGLLNCHRVVYPLTFGGPGSADDWTLADWCDQCHRKNGLVVWTRVGQENSDLYLGEALIDLLLGKVDALEIDQSGGTPFCGAGFQPASTAAGWKPAPHSVVLTLWYDLLEVGMRVPLVGSSAKNSNANCLGAMRTFGRLLPGEEFHYRTWIEAVRGGRTFVSNGPVLLLTVNN